MKNVNCESIYQEMPIMLSLSMDELIIIKVALKRALKGCELDGELSMDDWLELLAKVVAEQRKRR